MDGTHHALPSGWHTVVFPELDRSTLRTVVSDAASTEPSAMEIAFVQHVYERTGDWLRDGSVVFRYRYPNSGAWMPRLPKP